MGTRSSKISLPGCNCAACQFIGKALIFQADYDEFEAISCFAEDQGMSDAHLYKVMDARATVRLPDHTHQWH